MNTCIVCGEVVPLWIMKGVAIPRVRKFCSKECSIKCTRDKLDPEYRTQRSRYISLRSQISRLDREIAICQTKLDHLKLMKEQLEKMKGEW